jgi:predicted nuclease of predicted toxin-antitoxin system
MQGMFPETSIIKDYNLNGNYLDFFIPSMFLWIQYDNIYDKETETIIKKDLRTIYEQFGDGYDVDNSTYEDIKLLQLKIYHNEYQDGNTLRQLLEAINDGAFDEKFNVYMKDTVDDLKLLKHLVQYENSIE